MNLTYQTLKELYAKHGYKFYDEGKFNVNFFGIRKDLTVDIFNDILGVAYRDENNEPKILTWAGTTKPGLYWLKNKLGNVKGTFILKPGYFEHCWKIGKHKGEYKALVQARPGVFVGWRDNDSDGKLDMTGPLYTDVQGLNFHTTSHLRLTAQKVGAYSASCQVVKNTPEHDIAMAIAEKAADLYGNSFSYALFE